MITGEMCFFIYIALGLALTAYGIHVEGGLPEPDDDPLVDGIALLFLFGIGAVTWPSMLWWYKVGDGNDKNSH